MLDCLGDLVNREPSEHGAARYNGCDDEGDLWWFALHRKGGILRYLEMSGQVLPVLPLILKV